MANGNGGKRPGSGRKPQAVKLALAEKIDNVISDAELIASLVKTLKEVRTPAAVKVKIAELLLAYKHGRPRQALELSGPDAGAVEIGVKVVDYRNGLAALAAGSGDDRPASGETQDAGDGPEMG